MAQLMLTRRPEVNPQIDLKIRKLSVLVYVCNLSTGEMKTADARPASLPHLTSSRPMRETFSNRVDDA